MIKKDNILQTSQSL